MISVRLPDGSSRELEDQCQRGRSRREHQQGPREKRGRRQGRTAPSSTSARPLPDGAEVAILTKKDEEALEVLRHSAAHLMADAILRVFPKAQLTIGPVVENGFYYDIFMPDGKDHP